MTGYSHNCDSHETDTIRAQSIVPRSAGAPVIAALILALSPVGQVSIAPVDQCAAQPAERDTAPSAVHAVIPESAVQVQVRRTGGDCASARLQVLAYEPSLVQVACDGVPVRLAEVRSLTPWAEPSTAVQTHRDSLLVSLAEVASGPWPAMEVVVTPLADGVASCTITAEPTRGRTGRVAAR